MVSRESRGSKLVWFFFERQDKTLDSEPRADALLSRPSKILLICSEFLADRESSLLSGNGGLERVSSEETLRKVCRSFEFLDFGVFLVF